MARAEDPAVLGSQPIFNPFFGHLVRAHLRCFERRGLSATLTDVVRQVAAGAIGPRPDRHPPLGLAQIFIRANALAN